MTPRILVSRQFKFKLLTTYSPLVGMDEVGRGTLAGSITVGACAITGSEREAPPGLADSKLLSAKKREEFAPQVRSWAAASAVAWASNEEIDRFGIIVRLRLAGMCALARIEEKIGTPVLVLLDDSHDWLMPPEDLLTSLGGPEMPDVTLGEVMMRVEADAQCTLVATASAIAKVAGDEHMTKLEDPGYGWASNKGYSSSQHVTGPKALEPSFVRRRSRNFPGI